MNEFKFSELCLRKHLSATCQRGILPDSILKIELRRGAGQLPIGSEGGSDIG